MTNNGTGNDETPEMYLSYDENTGKKIFIRLKSCPWSPPNAEGEGR